MNQDVRRPLTLLLALAALACDAERAASSRSRSEAVSSASREMSGPSLFSNDALDSVMSTLMQRAGTRALRLEIHARELILQAEDPQNAGAVLEYHYREGKLGEVEHATLRGKGELSDNLFDLSAVKLQAVPALVQEALERVDPDGTVDYVLVRRNLPESEDVQFRVYVSSPRQSGYLDADAQGRPL